MHTRSWRSDDFARLPTLLSHDSVNLLAIDAHALFVSQPRPNELVTPRWVGLDKLLDLLNQLVFLANLVQINDFGAVIGFVPPGRRAIETSPVVHLALRNIGEQLNQSLELSPNPKGWSRSHLLCSSS